MNQDEEIDVIRIGREQFPNTIQIEGMDDAIIGISIRKPHLTNFVYSVNKIVKVLMEDDCSYDDAIEWYEYNIKPLEDLDEKHSPMFFDDRPHFSLN